MPRASMGESTIRMPAGKAAGCGARTATGRLGSKKAARAQARVRYISSFGQIRWRTEARWRQICGISAQTPPAADIVATWQLLPILNCIASGPVVSGLNVVHITAINDQWGARDG